MPDIPTSQEETPTPTLFVQEWSRRELGLPAPMPGGYTLHLSLAHVNQMKFEEGEKKWSPGFGEWLIPSGNPMQAGCSPELYQEVTRAGGYLRKEEGRPELYQNEYGDLMVE